jgi:hypothetical protein
MDPNHPSAKRSSTSCPPEQPIYLMTEKPLKGCELLINSSSTPPLSHHHHHNSQWTFSIIKFDDFLQLSITSSKQLAHTNYNNFSLYHSPPLIHDFSSCKLNPL